MVFQKRLISVLLAVVFVFVFSIALYAAGDGKININTAGVEELVKLEKIGEKYAQRIIQYREKNGPFEKPEDIMKVKGIGSKIWELNKDRIVVK